GLPRRPCRRAGEGLTGRRGPGATMASTQPPYDDAALDRLSARDLAAAIPDPVIMVDGRGAVRYANEAAVAAFGAIPQGTILAHRFRTSDMQRLLAALLAEGRSGAVDY